MTISLVARIMRVTVPSVWKWEKQRLLRIRKRDRGKSYVTEKDFMIFSCGRPARKGQFNGCLRSLRPVVFTKNHEALRLQKENKKNPSVKILKKIKLLKRELYRLQYLQ